MKKGEKLKKPARRLSQEECVEMLAMLMSGYSQVQVGHHFGVSHSAISQRLKRPGVARSLIEQVLEVRASKIRAGLEKSIDIIIKDLEHPDYQSRADAAMRLLRFGNMAAQATGRPILTGEPERVPAVVNNMQANVAAGGGAMINLSTLVRIAEEKRGEGGE